MKAASGGAPGRAGPLRAHRGRALGDSMPPEPPLDEAYFARMLEDRAPRLHPR